MGVLSSLNRRGAVCLPAGRGNLPGRHSRVPRLPLAAFVLLLAYASLASAQFGTGMGQDWTIFDDPQGRFSLRIPPGWTFQPDMSDDDLFVFYGTGDHDLLFVELVSPATPSGQPAAEAQEALRFLSGPSGPAGFQLVSAPTAGSLAGKEASFIVYGYREGGVSLLEGRAFVQYDGRLLSVAFADEAVRFNNQVPTFNAVMQTLVLHETARPQAPAAGFGVGAGLEGGPASGMAGVAGGVPSGQAAGASPVPVAFPSAPGTPPGPTGGYYTSPGGHYRFAVPGDWELWEEQSTARGDAIEPWHGVLPFGSRSTTKSLFLWDYFDEWEQKGAQYEILLAVIDNVPVTVQQALEELKNNVMGQYAYIYTVSTRRARLGGQAGVAADIVVRPNYTEPWSAVDLWYRTVTFYALKSGSTFFVWVIPKEIEDNPVVVAAMESFEWLGR